MAVGHAQKQEIRAAAPLGDTVPITFEGARPRPTRDLDEVKADLARAGYAIVEGVLTDAQAGEARGVLAAEIAREEAIDVNRVRGFFTDTDDKNRRLSRLPNRHKWFRDFVEHPVALELTRHILGPQVLGESYLVHSYGANVTRPGSAAQMIHRDRAFMQPYVDGPLQSRFIWCLDDFTEENGATRVVPGSHKWRDLQYGLNYESWAAEAPRGSVIVYTDLILHGTGANVSSSSERAGAIVGYCPPWCKPMINFPLVLDPEVMQGTSVTLRQLLGYCSVSLGFDEEWESAPTAVRDLTVPPGVTW